MKGGGSFQENYEQGFTGVHLRFNGRLIRFSGKDKKGKFLTGQGGFGKIVGILRREATFLTI